MRDRWQRILGGGLVVVGISVLLATPKQFSLIWLFAFMSCWTIGALLWMGLLGTHPEAALRRRLAQEAGQPAPFVRPEIAERVFRYGARPWRRALATAICVLMGAAFFVCGIVVCCLLRGDIGARLSLGIGSVLFGVFLCYYGWRYLYVRITVSPVGIEACLYFRTVRIRWDEVVVLITRHYNITMVRAGRSMPTLVPLDAGRMYWVYSRRAKLWFSGYLVGAADLVELISRATGLGWEDPGRDAGKIE